MCSAKTGLNWLWIKFQNTFNLIFKTKKESFLVFLVVKIIHSNLQSLLKDPHVTAAITVTNNTTSQLLLPSPPTTTIGCHHYHHYCHYDHYHWSSLQLSSPLPLPPSTLTHHRHCCQFATTTTASQPIFSCTLTSKGELMQNHLSRWQQTCQCERKKKVIISIFLPLCSGTRTTSIV